ncbi:MAG: hypothetical protein MUP09_03470 [Thiovulaceae bacterium]|nr:hypothetical protein [Sulfurimonadaceae bacterium]
MTTVEIIMMVAFVLALVLSGWKLYTFMPTRALKDDDTTPDSKEKLKKIMYEVIREGAVEEDILFDKMKEHPHFDKKHFWRFNQNRLRQLLKDHYLEYPGHQNIRHIHHHLKKEETTDH